MVVLMWRTALVLVVAVVSSGSVSPQSPTPDELQAKVVRVVAERFTFTPAQVRVKRGTRVEFRLRSEDTNHGFRILGTRVNVVVPKRGRGEMTVSFDAVEPGRYVFECSKPCGAGHSIMRGEIIVE
jgi:cytochrome c oxidase subunit 2